MPMPRDSYVRNAIVDRVVDGDTLWLFIDLGDDVWRRRAVRLARVDAPDERKDPIGFEKAKTYVRELLPKGTTCVVQTIKSRDKYGRLLAELWIPVAGNANLSDRLLELGHAQKLA